MLIGFGRSDWTKFTWVSEVCAVLIALASTPAHAVRPETPLVQLMTHGQFEAIFQEIEALCPEFKVNPASPVRAVLTEAFFDRCIKPYQRDYRGKRSADSAFYTYLRVGLERDLRHALAPHWLTLNLSDQDLRRLALEEKVDDLRPLTDIVFTNARGRAMRADALESYGIFVVRDFNSAFAAELKLPKEKRFRFQYQSQEERIVRYKAVINEALGRPAQPAVDLADVRTWLEATKDAHSSDSEVAKACAVLLGQLGQD